MEDSNRNNADSCGDYIVTAAASLEEEVVQQNKLEAALKQEVLNLHQFCAKRAEEIAQLRRKKWELEEKLQVLNIQNDLMNEELTNENKQFEAEMAELTKLEQAVQEEKKKQIKNVEEYERQINDLFQKLDSLPSLYGTEKIRSDTQSFKEKTEVNKGKLLALKEDTQFYKDKYKSLESGEETRLIDILTSISVEDGDKVSLKLYKKEKTYLSDICVSNADSPPSDLNYRTELEETAREINKENEQNEKLLQCLKNEALQLKQDIAKLQKLSS